MRYRMEDPTGDYIFGTSAPFLVNTPAAVGQAVLTRLKLYAREWFLDQREGLDLNLIFGYGTQATRDHEVQRRIIETIGVKRILTYNSRVNGRVFSVAAEVDTIYGPITISGDIR